MFSDKYRFNLDIDSLRTPIWKAREHVCIPKTVQKDTFSRGIMMKAGIMLVGCTYLHISEPRSISAPRYREVIELYVRFFSRCCSPGSYSWMITSLVIMRYLWRTSLKSEHIQSMHLPDYSPYLNPIERVWNRYARETTCSSPATTKLRSRTETSSP